MIGKKRFFLEIAYYGGAYHGWQIQENAISVQECLNKALHTLLREPIETIGAGRTDTGVHARQLYAHFDVNESCTILADSIRFLHALNALLPYDIAAKRLIEVPSDAHARFDAIRRSYEYRMHFEKDPFNYLYSCFSKDIPDTEKMNEAAAFLLGKQDFGCFSKSNTQVFTNICTIERAEWLWQDQRHLIFHITADRFLRNMVRAIVGTMLEIGIKNKPVSYMKDVIESKNRSKAGASVPARGLYLTEVYYPYIN